MAILTGYLPMEQGVACYAALRQHADTAVATGDNRTQDQIMADTLVERVTGQARAIDVNVELQLTMPLDSLINRTNASAAVVTYARIKKLMIGCWMIHDLSAGKNTPKCTFMSSSDARDLEKM